MALFRLLSHGVCIACRLIDTLRRTMMITDNNASACTRDPAASTQAADAKDSEGVSDAWFHCAVVKLSEIALR